MRNFIKQATQKLGKKRMEYVEFIEVDFGADTVFVVGLNQGYHNEGYGETMWQFNENHLLRCGGDMTTQEMWDDLMFFFSDIEKILVV
jgi:hypothetical protein